MPAVAGGLAVRADATEAIAPRRAGVPLPRVDDSLPVTTTARAGTTTPWPILRANARSVLAGLAACLVVLVTIELAVFRSGFFIDHVTFSSPIPAAKIALAARYPDTRTLFVGDSTVLTGVMPAVVSEECRCGGAFNAAFAYSGPWLTAAMTRRVIQKMDRLELVVISVGPWDLGAAAKFEGGPYALELLSPDEAAGLGLSVDLKTAIDARVGSVWSAYGQRSLVLEWLASLVPGNRYDESERGYHFVPGSLLNRAQLEKAAAGLDPGPSDPPSSTGPGAAVIASLITELRARGISAAILLPPLHPVAQELAGPYLERWEASVRDLASAQGASIVDCRTAAAPSDFRDLIHLNRSGAAKHSACIGAITTALVNH